MPELTISQESRKKGVSRQRIWQMRKQKAGLCIICGAKRGRGDYLCDDCLDKRKRRERP